MSKKAKKVTTTKSALVNLYDNAGEDQPPDDAKAIDQMKIELTKVEMNASQLKSMMKPQSKLRSNIFFLNN